MSYALRIAKRVPHDIEHARAYYERLREGLGNELVREVYHMIDLVAENPYLLQKRYGEYRMAVTKRFRYKVYYRIYDKQIRVAAVQHPSQHPTAWQWSEG